MAMSRVALSRIVAPRNSAMPYSVATLSTVFLSVVTTCTDPKCDTMRLTLPRFTVALNTMKPCPPAEYVAPRAKSACPPDDDQYLAPMVSDAHCPSRSTSMVALVLTIVKQRQHRVGYGPDTSLDHCPIGDPFGYELGNPAFHRIGQGRHNLHQRSTTHTPSQDRAAHASDAHVRSATIQRPLR